jgi:hypothetical protein
MNLVVGIITATYEDVAAEAQEEWQLEMAKLCQYVQTEATQVTSLDLLHHDLTSLEEADGCGGDDAHSRSTAQHSRSTAQPSRSTAQPSRSSAQRVAREQASFSPQPHQQYSPTQHQQYSPTQHQQYSPTQHQQQLPTQHQQQLPTQHQQQLFTKHQQDEHEEFGGGKYGAVSPQRNTRGRRSTGLWTPLDMALMREHSVLRGAMVEMADSTQSNANGGGGGDGGAGDVSDADPRLRMNMGRAVPVSRPVWSASQPGRAAEGLFRDAARLLSDAGSSLAKKGV